MQPQDGGQVARQEAHQLARCWSQRVIALTAVALTTVSSIGCASRRTVSFYCYDPQTMEPVSPVAIEREAVKQESLFARVSELQDYGTGGPIIRDVTVSTCEIWRFQKQHYHRTRVRVDGHVAYILSDATSPPLASGFQGVMQAFVEADRFEYERATRQVIGKDGIVTVPLTRYPPATGQGLELLIERLR